MEICCTFEKTEPFPTLLLNSTNSYGNMPVVIVIKHPNEFVYDMVEGDTRRLLSVLKNELLEAKMILKLIHEHFGGGVISKIYSFLGLSIIFIYGAIAND